MTQADSHYTNPVDRSDALLRDIAAYDRLDRMWNEVPRSGGDDDPDLVYGRPLDALVERIAAAVPVTRDGALAVLAFAVARMEEHWDRDPAVIAMITNVAQAIRALDPDVGQDSAPNAG